MRDEHAGTYFISERFGKEERNRLALQDQMTTAAMGGVLTEHPGPRGIQRVLDVGCGTGGWLIDVAKAYPTIALLIGVDINSKMVEHSRAQAVAQHVDDRVEFHVMDALRILEFPNAFFDLVNQRLGMAYLRTWDWWKLLQEYRRVARPGGIIRITEGYWTVESTSPALARLFALLQTAFYNAGHSFTPTSDGVTRELANLLNRFSIEHIQQFSHKREYRAGTAECQQFVQDMTFTFRLIVPFLHRWTRVPDDYESLYQQALTEMQAPDFAASGNLLTVWGKAP